MLAVQDEATLDQAVDALKFLCDKNRLRILSILAQAETCVCDLIDELELSQTLVSYHLARLRKAGLVRARREAQWIYYSLDPEAWERLIVPLGGLFTPRPLPPEAAYGASHRCDDVPPDPKRGACACEPAAPRVNGRTRSPAPREDTEAAMLSPEALDRIADEVLVRLLTRLADR